MSSHISSSRPFVVGSVGWTESDLAAPDVVHRWNLGRYEIVDGVLTELPAAHFGHGHALAYLMFLLREQFKRIGLDGKWSIESDVVIDEDRVLRADAVFIDEVRWQDQEAAAVARGRPSGRQARVYVPPALVIESVSAGHERHDRVTKRKWYAEFGVTHYWLLDAERQTLECLILDEDAYRVEATGTGAQRVNSSAFGGVTVDMAELWD